MTFPYHYILPYGHLQNDNEVLQKPQPTLSHLS